MRWVRSSAVVTSLCVILLGSIPSTSSQPQACKNGYVTFELITGFVYTSPSDTLEMLPGTLQLTDCLAHCKSNDSCQAINFETGLCVLLASSASQRPASLTPSQFPVFTIYAQKICLLGRKSCDRDWAFERISNFELKTFSRRHERVGSREECMELCLAEDQFECRSANYDTASGECSLSDMDRHSVSVSRYFSPSSSSMEYLESNCIWEPVKLCEFRRVNGRILKTVDSIYQDVRSIEKCKEKCLSAPYRCHSFDFGDPANSVCRLSHHAAASLTHIQEPYLEIPGAMTFELAACYNVSIQCRAREMVARVKTSKVFNGKVYAKSRPNSCVADVANSLEFEIKMSYHDLDCDVKQEGFGQFSNDIVIQHHDMIVTTQDLGLSVHCQYDLSNRSVSHGVHLEVGGDVDTTGSQSATVASPNVTMRITDRQGQDILTAQVGDPLALRFEIVDKSSPYEIFVRELVAVDGIDSSEILLIDSLGCPTDIAIMGPMTKVQNSGQILNAPFDAFKFPTSEIVQFRALVTPCLPSCEPVQCSVKSYDGLRRDIDSLGRRRRKRSTSAEESQSSRQGRSDDNEELVVVQTIHITDKFGFERTQRKLSDDDDDVPTFKAKGVEHGRNTKEEGCVNIVGLIVACSLFLLAQLVLILAWACVFQKRRQKLASESTNRSIDMLYSREQRSQDRHVFENPNEITGYDVVYNLQRRGTSSGHC